MKANEYELMVGDDGHSLRPAVPLAANQVHVAVADGGEFDTHFAGVRRIKTKVFDDERLAELGADGGFDL